MHCFIAPALPTRTSPSHLALAPNLLTLCPPPRATQLIRASSGSASEPLAPGPVHLIGTGPAAPDLLTAAALRKLRQADVIVYDRLVSRHLLSLASPAAQQICVGKARAVGTGSQPAIHQLLAEHARRGKTVARLKGGDPSIFGRLGAELAFLREQRIPVSVEPGVTTASAVAAALRFPLTHKHVAQGVCLVTAHDDVLWVCGSILRHVTLVVYMGLQNLGPLLHRLQQTGACGSTAAVAVHAVSTERQAVVWGNIDTLCDKVRDAALSSPTIVVIGNVVRLAPEWPDDSRSASTG